MPSVWLYRIPFNAGVMAGRHMLLLVTLVLPLVVQGQQYLVAPTPSPYAAIQDTNMGIDALINTDAWEIEGDLLNSWTLQSGTTGAKPENVFKRNTTGPQGRTNAASWWDGDSMWLFGGRGYAKRNTSDTSQVGTQYATLALSMHPGLTTPAAARVYVYVGLLNDLWKFTPATRYNLTNEVRPIQVLHATQARPFCESARWRDISSYPPPNHLHNNTLQQC
jgi:hypothetical protein